MIVVSTGSTTETAAGSSSDTAAGSTTDTYTVINPATARGVTDVHLASVEETDAAIERAQEAFGAWRSIAPICDDLRFPSNAIRGGTLPSKGMPHRPAIGGPWLP